MACAVSSRAARLVVPAYALALTLLITGPLLAPGYLLLRDAVSTPRSYLSDAALGLSESAPRAAPQDFLVAITTGPAGPVDGGVLVKVLLIVGLWAAGWGAARLAVAVVPEAGLAGQAVAVTVAIWNPYVAERLLQGHWSLLVGYGALPWVATSMLALRSGTPARLGALCGLAFWIAAAGLTPTGLLLAAVVALASVAAPGGGLSRWLCAATATVVAALAALPWLVASSLTGSLSAYQAAGGPGFAAFAARAEPGLGTLGSLAGLGGIWNADAVPGSRATLFAVLGTVVLLAIVAAGLPVVVRRPTALPLLVLAAAAVVLPAVAATGPGLSVLRALAAAMPGLGVLRDGQKWVALALPGYSVAGAGAVLTLSRSRPALVAGACCVALVATMPDLAWGVWGRVTPVRYPAGWTAVAERINADPRPVAVLPVDTMRRFAWSGPAPVLDPLPRWVSADVLSTGDLTISGHTVQGEGGHAREVQHVLLAGADPAELEASGVGWVVVESGTSGEMGSAAETLDRLPVAYRDADLTLYRVGGERAAASAERRRVAIAAHLLWLAMLVAGAIGTGTALAAKRRADKGRRV